MVLGGGQGLSRQYSQGMICYLDGLGNWRWQKWLDEQGL
jgi:hypothetical protein